MDGAVIMMSLVVIFILALASMGFACGVGLAVEGVKAKSWTWTPTLLFIGLFIMAITVMLVMFTLSDLAGLNFIDMSGFTPHRK